MDKKLNFDVVIIGAGPAGLTASIYLKRANLNVLVIEKEMPGGQMNYASLIENYPGYEKIEGSNLSSNMYLQAKNLGVEFKMTEVIDIQKEADYKKVITKNDEINTKNIIIASGRQRRKLNIPNEQELIGRGISYCALCDGAFFKDKNVVVIGGGNSAIEEAIHLSKLVKHITVIHRKDKFTAEKILVEELLKIEKIDILYNSIVTSFDEKNGKLSGVHIQNNVTNEKHTKDIDGAFIYIGYEPNIEIFKNLNIENSNGYILVNNKMETNIPGVYACGDVIDKSVYQIISAAAEGMEAATSIIRQ